jgi:hypothetical protein
MRTPHSVTNNGRASNQNVVINLKNHWSNEKKNEAHNSTNQISKVQKPPIRETLLCDFA